MKKYSIYPYHTDLIIGNDSVKITNNIKVIEHIQNNTIYKTIIFNTIVDNLEDILKNELINFTKEIDIKHLLIIGIGNDNYTSDSIGPKTLKHIKVNYNMGIKPIIKVSALEPGAYGETGILTEKIISSITKEIKPDLENLIKISETWISDSHLCNEAQQLHMINEIYIRILLRIFLFITSS